MRTRWKENVYQRPENVNEKNRCVDTDSVKCRTYTQRTSIVGALMTFLVDICSSTREHNYVPMWDRGRQKIPDISAKKWVFSAV